MEHPQKIILYLKTKGLSSSDISRKVGCSAGYIDKIANGSRQTPNFQVVDKLRNLYQEQC